MNHGKAVPSCLVLALMIAGAVGPASAADPAAETAVIAKVVRDSICWALTKNRALQESTMAHDEDLFIFWTESKSVVSGWKEYLKLFDTWMDPRWKATLTEVRDLRIHLSRSGDVAWYSAMLDDLSEWDGKPTGARDAARAPRVVLAGFEPAGLRDRVREADWHGLAFLRGAPARDVTVADHDHGVGLCARKAEPRLDELHDTGACARTGIRNGIQLLEARARRPAVARGMSGPPICPLWGQTARMARRIAARERDARLAASLHGSSAELVVAPRVSSRASVAHQAWKKTHAIQP